jgi:hypothetical protein
MSFCSACLPSMSIFLYVEYVCQLSMTACFVCLTTLSVCRLFVSIEYVFCRVCLSVPFSLCWVFLSFEYVCLSSLSVEYGSLLMMIAWRVSLSVLFVLYNCPSVCQECPSFVCQKSMSVFVCLVCLRLKWVCLSSKLSVVWVCQLRMSVCRVRVSRMSAEFVCL